MKNLKRLSEQSATEITPLYYSPKENAVYSTDGEERFFLTYLIRKNTPEEIEKTVIKFMAL